MASLSDKMKMSAIGDFKLLDDGTFELSPKFHRKKKISVPDCVSVLGKFDYHYVDFEVIEIPPSVRRIREGAFANGGSIEEVHISDLKAWCEIDFESRMSNPLLKHYSWKEPHKFYLNGRILSEITVPSGVSEIKPYTFYDANITSVKMPAGVKSIGKEAFCGCKNLISVSFPQGLESIGEQAFYGCCSLKEIVIPEGVVSIGAKAFAGCDNLIKITLPSTLKSISALAFEKCTGLKAVYAQGSFCNLDFEDEYSNPLIYAHELYINGRLATKISLPSALKNIKQFAFIGGAFTSVKLAEGIESIGSCAFKDCRSLITVELPQSLASIGDNAFENCAALTDLSVPSGAKIGKDAFKGCDISKALKAQDGDSDFYEKLKNMSGEGALNMLGLKYQKTTGGKYKVTGFVNPPKNLIIPDCVSVIGKNAFANCNAIKSVYIPDSVRKMEAGAFYMCTCLREVRLSPNCKVIPEEAFWAHWIERLVIPEGVVEIGASAFSSGCRPKSIKFPQSLERIHTRAFYNAQELCEVQWPDTFVNQIASDAFGGSNKLNISADDYSAAVKASKRKGANIEETYAAFKKFAQFGNEDARKRLSEFADDETKIKLDQALAASGNIDSLWQMYQRYLNGDGVERDVDKAIDFLKKAAQKCDVKACSELFEIYKNGELVPKNAEEAIKWLTVAADANDKDSCYSLGSIYDRGELVKRDVKLAIKYYLASSDPKGLRGDKRNFVSDAGYYRAAWLYKEIGDEYTTVRMFRDALKDPHKMYSVPSSAKQYLQEVDKRRRENELKRNREKAAQGDTQAMLKVAEAYAGGRDGLEHSEKKALKVYEEAANAGDAEAMYRAAKYYEFGYGDVPKDMQKALYWYKRAKDNGMKVDTSISRVQAEVNAQKQQPAPVSVQQTAQKEKTVKEEASKPNEPAQSDIPAQDMGLSAAALREKGGQYVSQKQYALGLRYYVRAAKMGDEEAIRLVGIYYRDGQHGIPKNDEIAYACFKHIAQKGNRKGVLLLAECFIKGIYVQRDYKKAQEIYETLDDTGWSIQQMKEKQKLQEFEVTNTDERYPDLPTYTKFNDQPNVSFKGFIGLLNKAGNPFHSRYLYEGSKVTGYLDAKHLKAVICVKPTGDVGKDFGDADDKVKRIERGYERAYARERDNDEFSYDDYVGKYGGIGYRKEEYNRDMSAARVDAYHRGKMKFQNDVRYWVNYYHNEYNVIGVYNDHGVRKQLRIGNIEVKFIWY